MTSDPSRLDALEIRVAHQDKTIADLNEVVAAQWRRIDVLERQLRMLREEFHASIPTDGPEPPPPHY